MEQTLIKKLVLPLLAVTAALLAFVGVSAAMEGDRPSTSPDSTTVPSPDCTVAAAVDSTDSSTDDAVDDVAACGDATDETVADDAMADDTTTDDTTTDDTTADDTVADEGPVGEDDDAPASTDHPANHGAAVSEAAHTCPPGPEHGPCVSDVARSQAGKPDAVDDEADKSDETSDDDDTPATPAHEKSAKGNGRGGR